MNSQQKNWRIWVDTGGTFTDCLAATPTGERRRAKVLSNSALRGTIAEIQDAQTLLVQEKWNAPENFVRGFTFRLLQKPRESVKIAAFELLSRGKNPQPDHPDATAILKLEKPFTASIKPGDVFEAASDDEAPILAARLATQTTPGNPLPPLSLRLGTTKGTNALLERRGVATALFITKGFADLLRIGTQQRPDLFALEIKKPTPLNDFVVEVDERCNAAGEVLRPPRLEAVEKEARDALARGAKSAAVVLMHGYLNPAHEKAVAAVLREIGFAYVAVSSELAPLIKILPRAETAVVDAYIGPVIQNYIEKVNAAVAEGSLRIMTSAGGLAGSEDFRAKDSLLSGPAGGVVGAATVARRSGFQKIISFDMGGTSTDVSRCDGNFEYVFEHAVGDAHLVAPAIAIETVAAGGGSICDFDGRRLRVGPESAGASPGPACYGAGGPLTLTDVNLLLGGLNPEQFEIPISLAAAENALDRILKKLAEARGERLVREVLLTGFLEIANERMANAIRNISVRRGYDAAEYALVAFGGAGAQHACAIAGLLGMGTIIVPQDASLLSALGIGHAVIEKFSEKQVLRNLSACDRQIRPWLEKLAEEARRALAAEGIARENILIRRKILNLRFAGQETALTIDFSPGTPIQTLFLRQYETMYGYAPEQREIEVESMRVIASNRPPVFQPSKMSADSETRSNPPQIDQKRAFFENEWQDVLSLKRENLAPGEEARGPALIFEKHSAISVLPNWSAHVDESFAVILKSSAFNNSKNCAPA